ncbi:MAG TPA: class I tRNA ligase family protein, partial [Methylomirabilota bacterium]|nr:class I tRNA ligase family protein [Methylomirabilota bacterium]
KTKGNVIDPLGMVDEIGADGLRFALINGSAPGSDQRLTQAKLDGGRNFTTKLWNAARFVLGSRPDLPGEPSADPSLPVRWVRSRLADATERVTRQLDALDLGGYAATVHEAAWSDYCDWFLEMAKVDLRADDASPADRATTWAAAAEGLAGMLRLLHPLMPFVTEELWQALREAAPDVVVEPLLMRAAWPQAGMRDPDAEAEMRRLIELTRDHRNLRNVLGIPASEKPLAILLSGSHADHEALTNGTRYFQALAHERLEVLPPDGARSIPESAIPTLAGVTWIEVSDERRTAALRERVTQAAELETHITRLTDLLGNRAFVERAPAEVVSRERERLAELEEQRRLLERGD